MASRTFNFNGSGLVGGRCAQRKCGGDRQRTGHLVTIQAPVSGRTRIVFSYRGFRHSIAALLAFERRLNDIHFEPLNRGVEAVD
jgi:hypothetical protein